MFKSLISFCLSRRPIVLVGVILFLGAGFVAFKMLNIEAYPNPTPSFLKLPRRHPASQPKRWSVITRAPDRPLLHACRRHYPFDIFLWARRNAI